LLPIISISVSSTVGIGNRSCSTVSFTWRMLTHSRIPPFGFDRQRLGWQMRLALQCAACLIMSNASSLAIFFFWTLDRRLNGCVVHSEPLYILY
jgi:hypothetical protein